MLTWKYNDNNIIEREKALKIKRRFENFKIGCGTSIADCSNAKPCKEVASSRHDHWINSAEFTSILKIARQHIKIWRDSWKEESDLKTSGDDVRGFKKLVIVATDQVGQRNFQK